MRLLRHLRPGRARVGARALTAVGAAALVALLTLSGVTAPLDGVVFDHVAGARHAEGEAQVVVVAIDQDSLSRVGPWPWSDRMLAQLVDRLTEAGTRAVGLDLLLAQPSLYEREDDQMLAQALQRNGATVLPVTVDLPPPPRPAAALLPAAPLAEAAAALGHLDAPQDSDGVARRIALHAGLGTPRWPAFALALKALATRDARSGAPAPSRAPAIEPAGLAPGEWIRADVALMAYPTRGGVPHVPAASVLDGRIGAGALGGRIAIIGRTAAPTGVPGSGGMPSVDVQANAVARLLEGRAIWPMPLSARVVLSVGLVCLPLLLLGLPGMQRLWPPMALAMGLVILLSWILLAAGAWFPPLPALTVLAVGLCIGGAGAVSRARTRARLDPRTGTANRAWFDARLERETRVARRTRRPLSLMLIEARHQGPQAPGEHVDLAATLASALRMRVRASGDLVARLDAGRFAALLPATGPAAATAMATALMVDLEGRRGRPGPGTRDHALRMGLASLQPEDTRGTDLLLRATRDLVATRTPTSRA